jgi:hypothetical protein
MAKYKLETGGCGADYGDDYYDPGYYYLQIYKFDEDAGKWKEVWESTNFGGDELDGHKLIKEEFILAMPEFGLTPEDILDFDSDCIFDWEIKGD